MKRCFLQVVKIHHFIKPQDFQSWARCTELYVIILKAGSYSEELLGKNELRVCSVFRYQTKFWVVWTKGQTVFCRLVLTKSKLPYHPCWSPEWISAFGNATRNICKVEVGDTDRSTANLLFFFLKINQNQNVRWKLDSSWLHSTPNLSNLGFYRFTQETTALFHFPQISVLIWIITEPMILQNISIIPVLNYYLQAINTTFTKKSTQLLLAIQLCTLPTRSTSNLMWFSYVKSC